MKIRVFTLRLDPESGVFDDAVLAEFFKSNEALDVTEHWFEHEGLPSLTLVVRYRQARTDAPSVAARPEAARVAPEHRSLFDALRLWRNERAKRDGRPPYVLFTNNQLAAIAEACPQSKSQLEMIEGVGQGRLAEYAEDVLALTREVSHVSS